MAPMLAACPSFRPLWEAFLEEWSSEPDLPLYLALASLARHLISLLAARDITALSQALAVVERWHIEGDGYVREAATIGLLEDLQNESLHETTSPAELEPFLRPQSSLWWRKVERFWTHSEVVEGD